MNRRSFLRLTSLAGAGLALPLPERLWAVAAPSEPGWRTFEVTLAIEVLKPAGVTRLWAPAPLLGRTNFQRTLANELRAPGGKAATVRSRGDRLDMVAAEFPAGVRPALALVSRVATRDYAVDLAGPGHVPQAPRADLQYFLRSTKFLPTDGIVRETAAQITGSAKTDVAKARAIYEWIVDNTFRDPKTRGCGLGDIRFMLESRDLGGKCADLNALYVGLARAAGLPARDVYGIRVAPSKLGYKSLGASSATITKAQHCRAEVYLGGHGWVPVDPADVRKVALEEPPGNHPLTDELVAKARARLFGSWEMNWMAYNFAHDVALPGSKGGPVAFFMYPQAETDAGRLDSLDPENFKYEITAKEITGANL